ncbi:transporter substrate-binding domain-containing protein [Paracoccus pacificus]|uniref:Transporter substrate-binding domain-containing protein n=1 Tax=Paracoccus pacificus TaxID=1463598 RepID=A0ABW4RAI1_9RHOB
MYKTATALMLVMLTTAAGAEEIRIGSSADYPPWESVDAAGQIVGFDKDFGDEVCKRIAADCVWQNQSFDGLLPGLQIGRFDAVISAVSITDERAQKVDFSTAYADAPNAFVVPAGSAAAGATSVADLKTQLGSATVGVQTGTTHEQALRANFPDATLKIYDRTDQIADDLVAGRLDAGLMERASWEPLVAERGADKLVYAGPLLSSADFVELGQGQGIALGKGKDDLKKRIDDAITAMRADGSIKAMSEKWFGYDISKQ